MKMLNDSGKIIIKGGQGSILWFLILLLVVVIFFVASRG
jgi:hypothetical protein